MNLEETAIRSIVIKIDGNRSRLTIMQTSGRPMTVAVNGKWVMVSNEIETAISFEEQA